MRLAGRGGRPQNDAEAGASEGPNCIFSPPAALKNRGSLRSPISSTCMSQVMVGGWCERDCKKPSPADFRSSPTEFSTLYM